MGRGREILEEYRDRDCDSIHEDSSQLREFRDVIPAHKSIATSEFS